MDELKLEVQSAEYEAVVSVAVNGEPLLGWPVRRPPERSNSEGHTFIASIASLVLPPDSIALLPGAVPHDAMVATCSCGQPLDDAIWVSVKRERNQVSWSPTANFSASSIGTRFSFDLVAYLDEIDGANAQLDRLDTRAGRIARQLRVMSGQLGGLVVGSTPTTRSRLVGAMVTDRDEVTVDLAPLVGHSLVLDDRSDAEIVGDLLNRGASLPLWSS